MADQLSMVQPTAGRWSLEAAGEMQPCHASSAGGIRPGDKEAGRSSLSSRGRAAVLFRVSSVEHGLSRGGGVHWRRPPFERKCRESEGSEGGNVGWAQRFEMYGRKPNVCRMLAKWFTLLGMLEIVGGPGCVRYSPMPLPEPNTVARRGAPDLERLKVRAAELEHPLLRPVELDLDDGLSPDEAAVLAVLANPGLLAERDAHDQVSAQLVAAGLLPNPIFSAEVDDPRGKRSEGTVRQTDLRAQLDLGSLIGRAVRVAGAKARLKAVDLGIAWEEWQTAQAARLTTARLAMLKRRLGLVRDELLFQERTVSRLDTAIQRGDVTVQEAVIHRSALERLRGVEADLEQASASTRSRLNFLLGLPPRTVIPATIPAPEADTVPSVPAGPDLVARAMKSRLDLRALERGYEAQEASLREAVLAQFPSVSIGISRQRNETAIRFLGGFVNLELPIFNRGRAAVRLEEATRARLRHEYDLRIAQVRADIGRLVDEDAILEGWIAEARDSAGALKTLESAVRAAVAGGDADRLAWQEIRASLVDVRLRLARASQARLETRIALETAVGEPVVPVPGEEEKKK